MNLEEIVAQIIMVEAQRLADENAGRCFGCWKAATTVYHQLFHHYIEPINKPTILVWTNAGECADKLKQVASDIRWN